MHDLILLKELKEWTCLYHKYPNWIWTK